MRRSARSFAFAVALATMATAAGSARAQDEPHPRASEAREHFLQGREALKRGELVLAMNLFQKSQDILPAHGTLLNLASCEEKLGLVGSAFERYTVLNAQLSADDKRLPIVRADLERLKPRVPWLKIELAASAPKDTHIASASMLTARLNVEVPVNPARHVVVVTAPGYEARRYEVVMTEGLHSNLVVEPGKKISEEAGTSGAATPTATGTASGNAPPPGQQQARPGDEAARSGGGVRTAGFLVLGLGISGMAVFGITGTMANSRFATLEEECGGRRCTDPRYTDVIDSGRSLTTAANIGLIAGAAGLVGGGLMILLGGPSSAAAPRATLSVSPGGARLHYTGTF